MKWERLPRENTTLFSLHIGVGVPSAQLAPNKTVPSPSNVSQVLCQVSNGSLWPLPLVVLHWPSRSEMQIEHQLCFPEGSHKNKNKKALFIKATACFLCEVWNSVHLSLSFLSFGICILVSHYRNLLGNEDPGFSLNYPIFVKSHGSYFAFLKQFVYHLFFKSTMKLFCNMRLNLRLLGMCLYRTKDLSLL